MKISREAEDAIRIAIGQHLREENGGIEIFELDHDAFDRARVREYGVNWAGCGTMDTAHARTYAQMIERASEIAEVLNGCQLQISDKDSKFITSVEMWEKVVADFKRMLKDEAFGEMELTIEMISKKEA